MDKQMYTTIYLYICTSILKKCHNTQNYPQLNSVILWCYKKERVLT